MDLLKDPHTLLIVIGAVFLLIGLLGGGLEISAIRIPTVGKYPRVLLGVLGVLFVVGGLMPAIVPKSGEPSKPTAPTPSATTPVSTPVIPVAQPSGESGQRITPTAVPVSTAGLDRIAAQKVALEYVSALNNRDLTSANGLASLPFLMGKDATRSSDALQTAHGKLLSAGDYEKLIGVLNVETRTLGEWKAAGVRVPEGEFLKKSELGDRDFRTRINARVKDKLAGAVTIYVREVQGVPKVAGLWFDLER